MESKSAEFIAQQTYWSTMSGDHGAETYRDPTGEVYAHGSGPVGGPSLWAILGRPLGDGARVRVTVEVLEDAPVKTTNPWSEKIRRKTAEED
jgi:hypothetical protein